MLHKVKAVEVNETLKNITLQLPALLAFAPDLNSSIKKMHRMKLPKKYLPV